MVERNVTADMLIDELDRLALDRVGLSFIPPGEPWRNGYVESFNGRCRDECLKSTSSGRWPKPES